MTAIKQSQQEIRKRLKAAGWDFDTQLAELPEGILPRLRIHHQDNGQHSWYLDLGDSYLPSPDHQVELGQGPITGVVFADQLIRALWVSDEEHPKCSSIDNQPLPIQSPCDDCLICSEAIIGEGACKPKQRLWLLAQVNKSSQAIILNLPPTSLKHWRVHVHRLKQTGLPIVAVNTVLNLRDVQRNGYRYAEVHVGIAGIASKRMLVLAKQASRQLEATQSFISPSDYSDLGDRSVS